MPKRKKPTFPTDAEMLSELSTLDEVTAWLPTSADSQKSLVPDWCELVLEVKRTDDGTLRPAWPLNVRMPLRRHDGELIAQVLHDTLHPRTASQAALEGMWSALDDVVEKIQRRVAKGRAPARADLGQALGLATAIALVNNPVQPDVDEVREEAMDRFDARHA